MKEDTNKMIQAVKGTDNPKLKAADLSFYLSNKLKEKEINIYEAYLLNGEVINYEREGYILPAWNGRVSISTCLELMNQRLLALAFKDDKYANVLKEFSLEALLLCKEKRSHCIMDRYVEYMNINADSVDLLQRLYDFRQDYEELDYDEGPYHVEVFPYHYYEPEKILLEKEDLQNRKNVSADIEMLLIELNT